MNILTVPLVRSRAVRWLVWLALIVFGVYRLVLMPSILNATTDNGFDLGNSEIDTRKIEHGGPPKDGIPALDSPRFTSPHDATFLRDDDWIIGLEIDGDARAYPVKILNYHEIVNDRIGTQGVLISYCPLCRTAMAFDSSNQGMPLSFGVSGLLYNSDVLMYDRQTESLWSQIMGRAISGPLKGTELNTIPIMHTTWTDWLRRYPDTRVLSTNTGHSRRYGVDPYASYRGSNRIMFSVDNLDKRYHKKEFVIGLKRGVVSKVWPFSELETTWEDEPGKEYLEDRVNDEAVRVYFNPAKRSARITDANGRLLDGLSAYWFAWIAFHPDTEVFTAN